MTIAIVILILALILAYFYLKCSVMASLSTLMLVILATLITFTYYEVLAELFVSRGYGIQWAHSGCFILAFVLSFALLRALRDLLVGGVKIDLGNPLKISVAIICGLLTGVLICGNLLVAIGLTPTHQKMLYSRFSPDKKISLTNPSKSFLNTDGFVAGLYSLISRGSMSSGKSFATLHADYLSHIYLNRLKTKNDVLAVTSRKSLVLPTGKKKPVRIWDIPDKGKVTVVRMGLVVKNIQDGGAGNPAKSSQIAFTPAQIRMICKTTAATGKPAAGSGTAIWPIGFLDGNDNFVASELEDVIIPETKSFKNQPLWLDAVFEVPSGTKGVFLQFKQNAIVELPPAVTTSEAVENTLDGKDEEEQ